MCICMCVMESRGLREGQDASTIGPLYIIYFSKTHENFRLAEFQAAADFLDIDYAFAPVPANRMPYIGHQGEDGWRDSIDLTMDTDEAKKGINVQRPFMLVYLANDEVAKRLSQRVTCIKSIWLHWASAGSSQGIRDILETDQGRKKWSKYSNEKISWRAMIISHQRSLSMSEQLERVESYKDVLDLPGPIKMKGADFIWGHIEEWTAHCQIPEEEEKNLDLSQYEYEVGIHEERRQQRQRLLSIHIGEKISDGIARDLISKMDVKKRKYIGNTTMESQMSLIQAGMALAGPGKILYDPFAGTCSILLAAAAFGANVVASDIDGRMMRGKAKVGQQVAVLDSAKQYGLEHHFLDFICADMSQHPWRASGLFDAIVADPPYGVRAGAKQIGRREIGKQLTEPVLMENGVYSHQRPGYFPPLKPYALSNLLSDLMNFSAKLLVPKGRLVFWMPTMIESEQEDNHSSQETMQEELQLALTPDFQLVAHSLQDFGLWGRRLITLEKVERIDNDFASGPAVVLPSVPSRHLQTSSSERLRATDDPKEFRNQVSYRGEASSVVLKLRSPHADHFNFATPSPPPISPFTLVLSLVSVTTVILAAFVSAKPLTTSHLHYQFVALFNSFHSCLSVHHGLA